MILTLTINPSIDRLARISPSLIVGGVNRLPMPDDMAGGKGINVSHVLTKSGVETKALYPATAQGRLARLLTVAGINHLPIDIPFEARINYSIVDDQGVTTKLNAPGPTLSKRDRASVVAALLEHAANCEWVVLAGSLPPGVPRDFYLTCIQQLRSAYPALKIAVDTSDGPLLELGKAARAGLPDTLPTLITPNTTELLQLAQGSINLKPADAINAEAEALESAAAHGDFSPIITAINQLRNWGFPCIFVTLGAAGAVYATPKGTYFTAAPKIKVASTVGAGDAALAGLLAAEIQGAPEAEQIKAAVAYGSAAASLPSTQPPTLEAAECLIDGLETATLTDAAV